MRFEKTDTLKIISHLQKYLRDESGVYVLTMIKNDWDQSFENSYIVKYAKENQKGISKTNFKVEAIGYTFEDAVYNMYLEVVRLTKEGYIKGKEWINIHPKNKKVYERNRMSKKEKEIEYYEMKRKRNYLIFQLITKFHEWGFTETVDRINSFSSDNPPLYYKYLGEEKYLIFNHWNANNQYDDGFDCWIASYKHEQQVGKVKPETLEEIRLGFRLDRDLPLIEQFLQF